MVMGGGKVIDAWWLAAMEVAGERSLNLSGAP